MSVGLPFTRTGLYVLGGILMFSVHLDRVLAENRAFVLLNRCLVPTSWTSDLTRARHPDPARVPPAAACLQGVRQAGGVPPRLAARLQQLDGDIAFRDGRWRDAVVSYERAKPLIGRPSPGISLDIVNTLQAKEKDYPAALNAALEGLRETPEDHDLRVAAATLYLFYVPPYGRYREALSVMRPELGFTHPYFYNIAAGAYLGVGDFEKGLPLAAEGVRLARPTRDPSLPTSLYLLGLMQRCTGQSDTGRANLLEALALSSSNDQIRAALASDISALCHTPSANR